MTGTTYSGSQTLDTALPDGSFLVGSSNSDTFGEPARLHVHRVRADCRIVGTWGVTIRGRDAEIGAIAATPDGRVLVGGSARRRALVGRFFANGGLDRSFGDGGWARLLPEAYLAGYPFAVSSFAFEPSGAIVVGGSEGVAACCVQMFVAELTAGGLPIASFGRGGSKVIPQRYEGSWAVDVFPNSDGSVCVFDQFDSSFQPPGCGTPNIVRVLDDGTLDYRFDRAMVRTVRRVIWPPSARQPGVTLPYPRSPRLRFAPTLVSDRGGGFTLVGGLNRTCGVNRTWSSGVSVRIKPSGRAIRHLTRFRSPDYAFDSPAAIRLSSGRIVAAGCGASSALVQVFGPDGTRDPSVGDHGLLRVGLPRAVDDRSHSVDLLSSAGGTTWLVIGLPHEIDLTPIPVR